MACLAPGAAAAVARAVAGGRERRRAADGDEIELRSRLVALDPLEQRRTLQIRAALWRAGQLVSEEEHILRENLYFRNELVLLLDQAGFGEVTARGATPTQRQRQPTPSLVFVARKDG